MVQGEHEKLFSFSSADPVGIFTFYNGPNLKPLVAGLTDHFTAEFTGFSSVVDSLIRECLHLRRSFRS